MMIGYEWISAYALFQINSKLSNFDKYTGSNICTTIPYVLIELRDMVEFKIIGLSVRTA